VRGALEDWITVHPGDLIVGDEDGVIVIAADIVERVVIRVREWSPSESEARKEIIEGLPLLEALAKYGHL
jgi:regulator of RNase E activity RraA